ncbi:MAG: class I SAM-dependent methyltransferase [Deltaproteobacteria bacterium]|nr:MAG: class I SAM-dependent methyltransferase [Deltaproteobacteria bacterium]
MKVNWAERVWVNSPLRSLILKREIQFFKKLRDLPPESHCLEIGCGRGAGALIILREFQPSRLEALDVDPTMIRLAQGRKPSWALDHLLFYVSDAQHLPYSDASMDAVFNFGIIHHLEDWEQGIKEIARVLRKDGGFYFEEIYPALYANVLTRKLLDHPTENRFRGPEFRMALATEGLKLLSGYRETRFGILGVAVKG